MATGSPFVGREAALASLGDALDEARNGAGGIVLISGPAGIGKSRLVEEFVRGEAARGVAVGEGRCFQGLGTPPFWPWLQVVRTWLDDDPGLLDRTGPSARIVHEVLANPRYTSAGVDVNADSPTNRFLLFEASAAVLRTASADAPRLVVLEDLHWADTSSLQLLQYLADTVAGHRVLVVGTDREEDGDPETREILSNLSRGRSVSCHRLPTLSPDATESLVTALCRGMSQGRIARIAAQSGGVPLFVEELVRDDFEASAVNEQEDMAPLAPTRVPERLRGVIGQRLMRLRDETLEILRCAAVIGTDFDLGLLVSSLRIDGERIDASAVHAALDDAVMAGFLTHAGSRDRFRFSHSLLREAIYEELATRRRVHLHGCVGRALEARLPTAGDERLSEVAHHFYEAAIGGWIAEALHYGERAGERAMALFAYENARLQFARTLQVQDLQADPSGVERCRLLVALAEAEVSSGNVAAADEVARRAMALAREIGDAACFARAVMAYRGIWGVVGKTDFEHIRLLEEALRRLGTGDSALRVVLLGRLATELYWTGDHEHRIAIGREMLAIARRLGDAKTLVRALNSGHWALWQPDNPEERLAIALENVDAAERNGDSVVLVGGLVWMVIDLVELGRFAEARAYVARHAEEAERLGTPHVRWQATVMRAFVALLDGRIDEAEDLSAEALKLGGNALGTNAEVFFAVQMLQSRWHCGRLSEIVDAAESLSATLPGLPAWRAALALIYAESGRVEESQREIEALARDGFAAIPRDTNYVVSHAFLAEACAILGESRHASTLFARLWPHREHLVVVGNAAACFGAVAYFLGRLAVLKGDSPAAQKFYRQALDLYARERMPLLARHCESAAAGLGTDSATTGAERRPPRPAVARGVFRRIGGFWEVGTADRSLQVRNGKGMSFLRELLVKPGVEIAAVDLATLAGGSAPHEVAGLSSRADLGDAGDVLDARARAAYRARLRDLGDALREAEENGDRGRSEAARAEIELLGAELARATGLGGRGRKASAHAERARVNVTRAIKNAISWIADVDASLGRHLRSAVHTGAFCVYEPDPDRPIDWDVSER